MFYLLTHLYHRYGQSFASMTFTYVQVLSLSWMLFILTLSLIC